MKLNRNIWTIDDIMQFIIYLGDCKGNNQNWIKNIYKTEKICLAIPIPKLRQISNEILKGNYLQLIENYFTCINQNKIILKQIPIEFNLIIGILICKINEINLIHKYLLLYGTTSDSWAETDIIKLKINDKNRSVFFEIAKKFIKSEYIFVKRLGIIILFNFINDDVYLKKSFLEIEKLKNESNYYVNMAIAWLLCESFIKNRNQTVEFLHKGCINPFVIKKFVSKCRDSFRVSKADKEMLLPFKNIKN